MSVGGRAQRSSPRRPRRTPAHNSACRVTGLAAAPTRRRPSGCFMVAPAMSWRRADALPARARVPAEHPVGRLPVRPAAALRRPAQLPRGDRRPDVAIDAMRAHVRVRGCWRSRWRSCWASSSRSRCAASSRGRGFVLAILVLPWALPSVVCGVLWRRVFDPDNGLLNSLLMQPAPHQRAARLAGRRALGDRLHHARPRLGRAAAGQPDLPGRAAVHPARSSTARPPVDGAGGWRQFRHITLPLLRPSMAIALTDRHAARDRDLRRDLRAQRHGAEHALDPDPGLQRRRSPRPTSPTARRSRSCWPG